MSVINKYLFQILILIFTLGWWFGYSFFDYWPYYCIILAVFITYISIGSFSLKSQIFISSLYKKTNTDGLISLTFDDGPCPNTLKVLEILKRENQKATFFCIGHKIEEHPEIFEKIIAHGHEVGNHSYSHHNLSPLFPIDNIHQEISKTNELIEGKTGKINGLYRPPFGVMTPKIAEVVRQLKLNVIGWSIRSLDTVRTPDQTINHINGRLKSGDVVLLHDDREDCPYIVEEVIRFMKKNAMKSVSISELFQLKV